MDSKNVHAATQKEVLQNSLLEYNSSSVLTNLIVLLPNRNRDGSIIVTFDQIVFQFEQMINFVFTDLHRKKETKYFKNENEQIMEEQIIILSGYSIKNGISVLSINQIIKKVHQFADDNNIDAALLYQYRQTIKGNSSFY